MGLKKFFKKAKRFVKKAAPYALGAGAAYLGAGALSGAFASNGAVTSGVPDRSVTGDSIDLPPGSGYGPMRDQSSNMLSPSMWSSLGNLGSAGLSLYGGMQANKANARQAQDQMNFQEEMSNTSYQRATEDMKAAGLNPMLAYSQGGASSPGGASAQIEDAITPSLNSGRAAAIAQETLNNMRAQNAQLNAQTQNLNADTFGKWATPGLISSQQGAADQSSAESRAREAALRLKLDLDREAFPADLAGRRSGATQAAHQAEISGRDAYIRGKQTELLQRIPSFMSDISNAVDAAAQWSAEKIHGGYKSWQQMRDENAARTRSNQR